MLRIPDRLRSFTIFVGLVVPLSLSARQRLDDYALILNDAPLAENSGNTQRIASAQQALIDDLRNRKIPVTGAVQTVLNAVFVSVPPERAVELRGIAGVRQAAFLPAMKMHLNKALDLVKVAGAWSQVGGQGNAGAGIKIGILDSGIDQNHPAFNDPSLAIPSGFPKGNVNFTNHKVIVARSYVSQLNTTDPQYSIPDDTSPRDRSGHGTAIAMIAAGGTVQAPVATITGVAPKAWLGNYKVYGSPGVNDVTRAGALIQALEDALNDGMNIVAMSTGTPAIYGPLDTDKGCAATQLRSYLPANACDVRSQAVENAVRMGMTVVISAGNDGNSGVQYPTLGTINSPGTAPSVITVGASTNSHILFSTATVNGSGTPASLQGFDIQFGGPKPAARFTANLADIAATGNDGFACSALPAGSLKGAAALVQRGNCTFEVKANNVQAAGAAVLLLYLANSSDELFLPTSLTNTSIPTALTNNATGLAIKTLLQAGGSHTITLDPALHEEAASFDTVAQFSSRGPALGDFSGSSGNANLTIKPELVAVGTDLYTATQTYDPNGDLYDATGFNSAQGNSFSAGLVAGAVALVKQAHPNFTPAQLKSAVVNTATGEVLDNSVLARVTAVGAGKLNAAGAVGVNATIEPATLSFGSIASGALPISRVLTLTNQSKAQAAFTFGVAARDSDSLGKLTISPSSVTLAAGASTSISVQLGGSTPNPGSYEGQITIAASGSTLHVPYLYLVGNGTPYNVFPILGNGYTGLTNEINDFIAFRTVDQYGVPVKGAPVQFAVTSGGGLIDTARGTDAQTDVYGIAGTYVALGPQPSSQIFTATVGSITNEFDLAAIARPAIAANGVVNGGSFLAGTGLAAGSYATIAGTDLAMISTPFFTPYLPLFLAGVTVTFDAGGISVPGYISYVSPTQINVQIPWELQGQTSAQVKVKVQGNPSALYTLPLVAASPAAFEFTDATSANLVAAVTDAVTGTVITSNRPAARGKAISIYANGLGPVTNTPASGSVALGIPLSQSITTPGVTIGGKTATVLFSGLAPGYVGLYQINAIVPLDSPTGLQPLSISVGSMTSKVSQTYLN